MMRISDLYHENTQDADKVAAEAVLEGLYIIRTSVSAEQLTVHDTVRAYKSLSQVERAFRSFNIV